MRNGTASPPRERVARRLGRRAVLGAAGTTLAIGLGTILTTRVLRPAAAQIHTPAATPTTPGHTVRLNVVLVHGGFADGGVC